MLEYCSCKRGFNRMRSYILRRILLIIPTIILVTLVVFLMIRSIPGSVVDTIVSQYEYVTHDDIVAVRHELGLDKPVLTQYVTWLDQIFIHGDLGYIAGTAARIHDGCG